MDDRDNNTYNSFYSAFGCQTPDEFKRLIEKHYVVKGKPIVIIIDNAQLFFKIREPGQIERIFRGFASLTDGQIAKFVFVTSQSECSGNIRNISGKFA